MNIATVDFSDPGAAQDFTRSLRETGFAVLTNHPISDALIAEVYDEWQHFFEGQKKQDFLFSAETQDGYFPFGTENAKDSDTKDLKEFFADPG